MYRHGKRRFIRRGRFLFRLTRADDTPHGTRPVRWSGGNIKSSIGRRRRKTRNDETGHSIGSAVRVSARPYGPAWTERIIYRTLCARERIMLRDPPVAKRFPAEKNAFVLVKREKRDGLCAFRIKKKSGPEKAPELYTYEMRTVYAGRETVVRLG